MSSLPITRDPPRSVYSRLRNDDHVAAGWLRSVMTDRSLAIIAALCLIGLLITLNLTFGFSSFQPSVEEIAQFLG